MTMLLKKLFSFFQSVLNLFNQVRIDQKTESFIVHNKNIWGDYANDKTEGEILFEVVNGMCSSLIAYSYLANILSKKYNATIKGYVFNKPKGWLQYLTFASYKVLKSFNIQEIFYLNLTQTQLEEVNRMFNAVYPNLKTKRDVEGLKFEGLWVGDLVYDSHTRYASVPTVDISALKFCESLRKSLSIYVFWRDYFDSHNVKAVNVSHCVYNNAIILRLAIWKKIPAYQISAAHVYYLTEKNLWAYDDFYYFPEEFRKLPPEEQKSGMLEAEKRLARRFAGEVGVDMNYSTKSAYTMPNNQKVLSESDRIKILVATHCFFDSPHPYGVNLFPDISEWLTFLGEVSEHTDFDWYIKTHPDFLPGNIPIIEALLSKYPKFTQIPAETSHHQIIEEGIDFVLTVYGTIGFEYAALGVPVINASLCNPHIAYNFNIHPKSVKEYEEILMNLAVQKLDIDINEVYEYYYMKFINRNIDWLFDNYLSFAAEYNQFGPVAYQKFLEEFSEEKHARILCLLTDFVESKDYCMQKNQYENGSQKMVNC